jgi:uncharacterized protein
MKNLIRSFIVICILLSACDQKKEKNNLRCRKTFYENGNIKVEGCFIRDSTKEGLFKRHYQSGQVAYEINYHDNKEDGLTTSYYETGKRKFVVHYADGVRIGAGIEYYESGTIKTYEVYNRKGASSFKIEYHEDGSIKKGMGPSVVDYSANKDTLNIGDVLKIEFIVATPKESKVRFQFYQDAATKEPSQYLKVSERDGYGTVVYEKKLDKKGTMNWGGTYVIQFDDHKHSEVKFKFVGFTMVK